MIFIALQCCNCSTMQVKQQKSSSNKWTCVVCNQKQSVRKVFARGPMARDLRSFVQYFNFSRKLADERALVQQEEAIVNNDSNQRKKRRDWTEYLDIEDDFNEEDDATDSEIVTELPDEMFKKPKLRGDYGGSSRGEGAGLFKPVFSKRHFNKLGSERTSTTARRATTKGSVAGTDFNCKRADVQELRTCEPKPTSKWNQYMTLNENDNNLQHKWEIPNASAAAAAGQWDIILETTSTNDNMVEEDIHPDFL